MVDQEEYLAIKKAEKRIEKVIMKWFMQDPMMLEALNMFQKIPSPDQHTIGIDTKSNPPIIKFNPYFVNLISKEKLEGVMAQEGFKILLKHPTTRLCKPRSIASLSSNITVTPYSLGSILKNQVMEDFYTTPKQFGLKPEQCFEEYFRELMDRQDETNEKIKQIWNSMSDEEKQEAIDNAQSGSGEGEQEGQGKGEGKEDKKDSEGNKDVTKEKKEFKKFDNSKEAMKDYFDPNSTGTKDWGDNPLLDADIKDLVNKNKDRSKQWGDISGNMFEQIMSAHTPKISWKEIVRRFNKSVSSMRRYTSRMKLNRRYDLQQPGQRREYDTHIIFAIDSSGSMSDGDIAEGLAVINSICGHAKITYILFDTKITTIEKDFKKAKNNFKITGRGGTDFQEVINYADKTKVDGIVIFTDGYASEPTRPVKAKVMWLLHSKDSDMKPPCDWGYVAYLERFE